MVRVRQFAGQKVGPRIDATHTRRFVCVWGRNRLEWTGADEPSNQVEKGLGQVQAQRTDGSIPLCGAMWWVPAIVPSPRYVKANTDPPPQAISSVF